MAHKPQELKLIGKTVRKPHQDTVINEDFQDMAPKFQERIHLSSNRTS